LKFAKNILEAIRIHLQEEGANLKKLLEKWAQKRLVI
jgi:16S rRNA C1402 N4-methylase RsmH